MAAPGSVVVVGGGPAGVATVVELRSRGFEGAIDLVDATELPHDRPPLSKQWLLGDQDDAGLSLLPGGWAEEHDVTVRARTHVRRLLPDQGALELSEESLLRADAVVLATGGRASRPAVPGADLPGVRTLRDLDDARRLRATLGEGRRLVVVGAGLIGAEVASTANRLGSDVTVVDPLDPPLRGAFGDQLAAYLHGRHQEHGVRVVTGAVRAFRADGDGLVVDVDGQGHDHALEADVVLVGVGMQPDVALAAAAGLDVDRGVLVDRRRRTSRVEVLAVGDCAQPRGGPTEHLGRSEHWEAARLDGAAAAATLVGEEPPPERAPWFWSDRYGEHVEVTGSLATGSVVRRGTPGDGPFAVLAVENGRLRGAASVDDSLTVRAARRIIERDVAVDARQLADPTTDLRRLARG